MSLWRAVPTMVSLLAPLLLIAAVWTPELRHYYVPRIFVPEAGIAAARQRPADALLDELRGFGPGFGVTPRFGSRDELVGTAETLLQGRVRMRGAPAVEVHLPFAPDDLEQGPPHWALVFSGFVLPDLLLQAHVTTGRDKFLFAARDMIVGWATYERQAWRPRGFLWNDHAMAARAPVLAEFWRLYRGHPSYDARVAQTFLEFVARNAHVLADPEHFTFATNHGVMQNLALMHLALAFPDLPKMEGYQAIAVARLKDQFAFYVNDEGVVLEHSAGYHRAGTELIGMALRYMSLLGRPAPAEWVVKYRRATQFYAQLRRPDGSLPLLGDTLNGPDPVGPLITTTGAGGPQALSRRGDWFPEAAHALYPHAGYSIWWHGLAGWPHGRQLSQTVVAWSHFPGHGHKHADELSVQLWAGGQNWWSNVGYWPYSFPGRAQAESWDGSSAPHLVGEPTRSERIARLVGAAASEGLATVDVERRGPGRYRARRVVVHAAPNRWLVLDRTVGEGVTSTQWTTTQDVHAVAGRTGGRYELVAPSGDRLTKWLIAAPGATVRVVRGSGDFFAGWQMGPDRPQSATSIVVEQPAASWSVAVWCWRERVEPAVGCPDSVSVPEPIEDESWVVVLGTAAPLSIRRMRNRIIVGDGPTTRELRLKSAPSPGEQSAVQPAYDSARQKYPRFVELWPYRVKVTYLVLALAGLQEAALVVLRRLDPSSRRRWRWASVACWVGLGWWLLAVYFSVPGGGG